MQKEHTTSGSRYGVVYCPGKAHREKRKILQIIEGDLGACRLSVQCNDAECKRLSRNRGWYRISQNKAGGYTVKPYPKDYHFDFEQIPAVILAQGGK